MNRKILGFVLCFCKKKTEAIVEPKVEVIKPTKFIGISNAVKEWGYFKPGSYWIMQDSVSGTTDSIYVVSVTSETVTYAASHMDTTILSEQITIKFNPNSLFYSFTISSNRIIDNGPQISNELCFIEDTTVTAHAPRNNTPQNHSISSYTVLGNTYTDVRFTYFSQYHDVPHYHTYYYTYERNYWKKNVGIIKHYYFDQNYFTPKKTYLLLRYNIIQ